ncbi:MAG: MMPL family transporter, partial [Gammaproteobacteria bacterium]|nr:MMPL family transporter [Gammaproteobacteria bacterium]
LLVSTNFKAALIKATFNEGQLDYERIFRQVQQLRRDEALAGVKIHVSGQPMMVGWIYTYVGQILQVFLFTAAILIGLLVLYFRRLYGILLPLFGILLSSIWGLGIISLLGFNLDPLTLVVPFLISARAMSHGVQIVQRYYHEFFTTGEARIAARNTFDSLFRPGTLGVVSDAIGLLIIALGTVPINTKLAYYASLWAFGVIFTVLVFIPLVLTILPAPKRTEHRSIEVGRLCRVLSNLMCSRSGARIILGVVTVLFVCGAYLSSRVQIGEAEPGTPLLYPDHDYNLSSKAINTLFPGSEELYVIARTKEKGGIKRPEVLRA